MNSRSSSKLGTCEADTGISKTGESCRVRRWEACTIIMDEDGNLLRKVEQICARWERYLASLLNTTSAALDRTIIEGLAPKPAALSHGDPPNVDATKQAMRTMANNKAMGSNARIPYHRGCMDDGRGIAGGKHATINILYNNKKKRSTEYENYRSLSLVAHSRKIPWPIDLATSARKLGFSSRNNAVSGLNTRQPA